VKVCRGGLEFLRASAADKTRLGSVDQHIGDRHPPRRPFPLRFAEAIRMIAPHIEAPRLVEFLVGEVFVQAEFIQNRFRGVRRRLSRLDDRRRSIDLFNPGERGVPGRSAAWRRWPAVKRKDRVGEWIGRKGRSFAIVLIRVFEVAFGLPHLRQYAPKFSAGRFRRRFSLDTRHE
jgi:hypothetical protein